MTDNPLSDYLIAIAQSLGAQLQYNQQIVIGGPIRIRAKGNSLEVPGWPGYSYGKNRDSVGMNVVNELRNPQTIGGRRYDALVITERHDLIATLIWEDTVRYLRHFHERSIEGNPQATTYLFESWLGIKNKNDPSEWIAYERAASPVWQCVANRVNSSLTNEGRADRVQSLPAGASLAELVAKATAPGGVPGISGTSVRESVDVLFNDDVHLTPLGTYYMALVNYAVLYRRSPIGAWAPTTISPQQANSLQSIAWQYVSAYYQNITNRDAATCRALVQTSFCSTYMNYVNLPQNIEGCRNVFSTENQGNPLYFDPAVDGSYWYPAP